MSNDARDYGAIATRYAREVVADKFPACKWTKRACQRHLRDLRRSASGHFPFIVRADLAARACEFIEGLPHPTGTWSTPTITLEPWQIFIFASLFGWVHRDDPTRYRFREAFVSVARGNAKSTAAAAVAIYKYCAENERGAQVFFGASTREQAMLVGFTPALAMIENSPDLVAAFGLKADKKSVTKPGDRTAVMKTIIGKPGDGAIPYCVVVDEYHEHRTNAQREAMRTGLAKRPKNSLLLTITTSGMDLASPCHALQGVAEQILEGNIEDDSTFAIIFTVDDPAQWFTEVELRKANPNYGVSVDPIGLRSQVQAALHDPSLLASTKTKNANLWVNSAAPWITAEDWQACADPELTIAAFEGEECVTGLDLADRIDLAAKVLIFTRILGDARHFYLFGRYYLNQERIRQPKNTHYQSWVATGRLIETPGSVTSYPIIADELVADARRFIVREISHDPHHAGPLVQFVQAREDWDQQVECVEFTQSAANYSPAMREFRAAVLEGRMHHDGDPILAWAIGNIVCRYVGRELVIPDKARPEQKIDPAVAALMAFDRMSVVEPASRPSLDFV